MAEEKKEYEGRCMKCKKTVKIKDPELVEIRKGVWAAKGTCVICGTKVFRIVGKKK